MPEAKRPHPTPPPKPKPVPRPIPEEIEKKDRPPKPRGPIDVEEPKEPRR